MNEPQPLISIVIPVKNGDAWLEKVIPAMLRQTLAAKTEIIAIDSGSTDRTLEILGQYPVRIISIPSTSFNHGATRNLGVKEAKGRYVVMTVQDATPVGDHWLQQLLDGFDDQTVAGVCGQQIVPHDLDKNPVDWFRPISVPGKTSFHFDDPATFQALDAGEKRNICSWDNVNAMYSREALLAIPFRPLSFAEDAMWANDALLAGRKIVYNRAAQVEHYHIETPEYTFKRCLTVYYQSYKLFRTRPAHTGNELIHILRNIKLLLKEARVGWKDKWKWLRFNHAIRRAVNRSVDLFDEALAKSEKELDAMHEKYCGRPPQAVKPQTVNPQPVNPQTVNSQPVNPQSVNPQPVSPHVVNPQSDGAQSINSESINPE